MSRKELTKTLMMISNMKKPFGLVYKKYFCALRMMGRGRGGQLSYGSGGSNFIDIKNLIDLFVSYHAIVWQKLTVLIQTGYTITSEYNQKNRKNRAIGNEIQTC